MAQTSYCSQSSQCFHPPQTSYCSQSSQCFHPPQTSYCSQSSQSSESFQCFQDLQLHQDIQFKVPDLPRVEYGQTVMGLISRVIDGDTYVIIYSLIPLENHSSPPNPHDFIKLKMRLSGVDTPEKRTRWRLMKKAGFLVKDEVRSLLEGKVFPIRLYHWGTWNGRVIGDICLRTNDQGESYYLSEELLQRNLAIPYAKRTKGTKRGKGWNQAKLTDICQRLEKLEKSESA